MAGQAASGYPVPTCHAAARLAVRSAPTLASSSGRTLLKVSPNSGGAHRISTRPPRRRRSRVHVSVGGRMPTVNRIAELARLVHEQDRLRAEGERDHLLPGRP